MTDFGLIGHPVEHSMSRFMHEAVFSELGLDHTYGLFDVKPDELPLFMKNAVFKGLNVTIPLKTDIVEFMGELSPEALMIGSVNTIEFADKLVGHNTDVLGFMKMLGSIDIDARDSTFLVLGAGGAGRAITFKLAMEKSRVYSYDVDPERCAALTGDILKKTGVKVEQAASIEEGISRVDVLVNATPVGMYPNIDDTPVSSKLLNPALTVVDIIYNPVKTRLIAQAHAKGCKTVGGVGMLVHQGAEALRIWLGIDPPIDIMEKAVLDNL